MSAIDLSEKLAQVHDTWTPKIVGSFNGHDLMVVKVEGRFVWHAHPDTDDFFMVLSGQLTIEMKEGDVTLLPGQIYVVPKGVEHCPRADEPTELLVIEPAGTPNTGDPDTAVDKERI
ncbi:MAG: cupin domain-containing protein [Pseudomonadota bacterium]